MASYTLKVGTGVDVIGSWLIPERTKRWYVRLSRALVADPVSVRLYDNEAAATTGTTAYAASGSTATVAGKYDYAVALVDNAGTNPVVPTGALVQIALTAPTTWVSAQGAVVQIDLGPKIERATLAIVRAMAGIKATDGYYTTPAKVERGLRPWPVPGELLPYVGVCQARASSLALETGDGLETTLSVRVVGYCPVEGESRWEPNVLPLLWDIRRAALKIRNDPYSGLDDGPLFNDVRFDAGSTFDLGATWTRDRTGCEVDVILVIDEDRIEIGV